jgi:hypothetical protein
MVEINVQKKQFNEGSETSSIRMSNLDKKLNSYTKGSSLSPAGLEYRNTIIDALVDKNLINPDDVKSMFLHGYGEVVFLKGIKDNVFALIMKRGRNINNPPPTTRMKEITHKMRSIYNPKASLFDLLVINEEDYHLVDVACRHIINAFVYATDTNKLTLADVGGHGNANPEKKFYIDTNYYNVMSMVDQTCVHAVKPRIDYGFVLSVTDNNNDNNSFENKEELIVVGAYTDFLKKSHIYQPHEKVIVPIINISYIGAVMPDRELLAIVLPMIVKEFIESTMWMRPYLTRGAEDSFNLGAFINKPQLTDQNEAFHIINSFFTSPEIALMVSNGRQTIPGLSDFVYDHAKVVKFMYKFLGVDSSQADKVNIAKLKILKYYTGNVHTTGAEPYPVERLDYLFFKNRFPEDAGLEDGLLTRWNDPMDRVHCINERGYRDQFDICYEDMQLFLDEKFIMTLVDWVLPYIVVDCNPEDQMNSAINANMLGNGGYFGMGGFNYGGPTNANTYGGNGFNPYGFNY